MKRASDGEQGWESCQGGSLGYWAVATLLVGGAMWPSAQAATLEVGPGKRFARIEEAHAQARPGDVILVHALADGQAYERTSVFVRVERLTFRAVPAAGQRWVKISGQGFDYSGRGSTPRAIFQFNRGTDQCLLEGFELTGAHNDSHNGAGVRINQANHVTIRNCAIHHNDMGIMSNGDGRLQSGVNQRIEHCEIHHNGDPTDPGYNHNLYLGGTSVTLSACEVHSSLTGHNVKSRAHHTRVEHCYVHHSANREFDLVDAAETALPESHAVLVGNLVVKDPQCSGNRGAIHFGQDGGKEHDGTLHLVFNTIVTPFISPVVDLSAARARAQWIGNLVTDGGQRQNGQTLGSARSGASLAQITGQHNWFSGGFTKGVEESGLAPDTNTFQRFATPVFVAPTQHDYRLTPEAAARLATPVAANRIALPAVPGQTQAEVDAPLVWQYRHPADRQRRTDDREHLRGAIGPSE